MRAELKKPRRISPRPANVANNAIISLSLSSRKDVMPATTAIFIGTDIAIPLLSERRDRIVVMPCLVGLIRAIKLIPLMAILKLASDTFV